MNEKEFIVLKALTGGGSVDAESLARALSLPLSTVMSAAESLHTRGWANKHARADRFLVVTEKGSGYAKVGLPETRLLASVGKQKLVSEALHDSGLPPGEANVALGQSLRAGLLERVNSPAGLILASKVSHNPAELVFARVAHGRSLDEKAVNEHEKPIVLSLIERGLLAIEEHKHVSFSATLEGQHALAEEEAGASSVSQLSPELLKDGSWQDARFRPYDLSTVAAPIPTLARKHAYKEFLNSMKLTLVGMGFREIKGTLTELEFWNMDALFMPQDHPAREIHDVFRVKDPSFANIADERTFQAVFAAHQHGGKTGSKGWGYALDKKISSRLIARSHDTGISARELSRKLSPPDRVFFIARVFRPDEIDWKHFIEFNQLGGYVADESISFRDLLGILKTFAEEVFGAKKVKFAPNYFPFTEPSVEMYVEIPGRGWAEVGGAGMFRPEMLEALGVDHPVAAWGLGIDRLAMLTLGTTDIRDLHSHDLAFLRSH